MNYLPRESTRTKYDEVVANYPVRVTPKEEEITNKQIAQFREIENLEREWNTDPDHPLDADLLVDFECGLCNSALIFGGKKIIILITGSQ